MFMFKEKIRKWEKKLKEDEEKFEELLDLSARDYVLQDRINVCKEFLTDLEELRAWEEATRENIYD